MMQGLILAALFLSPTVLAASHIISIANNCPTEINLYVNGTFDSILPARPPGGPTLVPRSFDGSVSFYTDANGAKPDGEGALQAWFIDDGSYYFLFMNGTTPNTGLDFDSPFTEANGLCAFAECENQACPNAFRQFPASFPPAGSVVPVPPLYACPVQANQDILDLIFCPDKGFPDQGIEIHPGPIPGENNQICLDVRGGVLANGTPVQIFDCNKSPAQQWLINRLTTKVQLAQTNFCLDAGSTPGNGVQMKIWECFDNLPAQEWFYTEDNRIALLNQGLCLDLTNGNFTNTNPVQIWQCTDGNVNQVWPTLLG